MRSHLNLAQLTGGTFTALPLTVQRFEYGKTPLPLCNLLTGRFKAFLCPTDALGLDGERLQFGFNGLDFRLVVFPQFVQGTRGGEFAAQGVNSFGKCRHGSLRNGWIVYSMQEEKKIERYIPLPFKA